ncbi:chloride channel K [Danio rerio]|uniref:Chloride channel K n=1 Tax=Danio rerio TaxID=7955 RepID=Q7T329_DANRE|nr:chloride channel K [Danio rerio]AAH53277.1 Zgc:64141 [Danio rerio]|eukprot:NP_956676.1 chloride channel protein ClC-Ka [Danio rerio]
MDDICVNVKQPENENDEQRVQEDKREEATAEEKLISANEPSWKPWPQSRSQIRECVLNVKKLLVSLASMEWYCYALLGIITALMSFFMDMTVAKLLNAHQWLYGCLKGHHLLQFLCWTLYPACLCALSTSFAHSVCPYSAGSGVPEARAILLGVDMPDYLSLSNLFAKMFGLICTLAAGSTVFLGKVGPFVHLSIMVGAFMNRLHVSCRGGKQRAAKGEMLVVASAVGVASCFGAPISGVLFSIEVMGTHYSVSDYCPCFFAAACGAITFRLLSVCIGDQDTIQALFKTSFSTDLPFQPFEIIIFALLGLFCSILSCIYLLCHRWALRFVKTNKPISTFLATEKSLYSAIVAFLLACFTFYHSAGHFIASELTMRQLLTSMLDGTSWYSISQNISALPEPQNTFWQAWNPPGKSYFQTLTFFIITKVGLLVVACTLPLPAGYFMPVFVYGAAVGRFIGEGSFYLLSGGISSGKSLINPGGYALAGAAAFSGAVTHTLSPALLAVEMTGQCSYAVPALVATLVSNAVARAKHRPSFYDGISLIKRLPHLPSLIRACPKLADVQIKQFVIPAGAVLERSEKLISVQHILKESTDSELPVVESRDSSVLLGTINRSQLRECLLEHRNEDSCKQLEEVCCVQPVRLHLTPDSTVKQAHCIMSITGEQRLFITESGRLCGVITWKEMKKIIEKMAKEV